MRQPQPYMGSQWKAVRPSRRYGSSCLLPGVRILSPFKPPKIGWQVALYADGWRERSRSRVKSRAFTYSSWLHLSYIYRLFLAHFIGCFGEYQTTRELRLGEDIISGTSEEAFDFGNLDALTFVLPTVSTSSQRTYHDFTSYFLSISPSKPAHIPHPK